VISNGLNLSFPYLIGQSIDDYIQNGSYFQNLIILIVIALGVFVFGLLQSIISMRFSEKIAFDLRTKLTQKLTNSTNEYINQKGPSELITIYSSDVTNTKNIASMGIVYMVSAFLLLIGSIVMMFLTNVRLAYIGVSIVPIIVIIFGFIFSKVAPLFQESQKNFSKLSSTINESIFAASLIRVLNSSKWELTKFSKFNNQSAEISIKIVNLFSILIPSINLISNLAVVLILYFGGQFIISDNLTVGEFSTFFSYFNLLITPIFILGFTAQGFGRGLVSYDRILDVLNQQVDIHSGTIKKELNGKIEIKNLNLTKDTKKILKDINFVINPNEKVAIIGPTGAGKSQLLSLLIGLTKPTDGQILIDDIDINNWDQSSLLSQTGIVFQESLIFSGNLKDNIVFDSSDNSEENLKKAIYSSALDDFIYKLDNGLDTEVSERGTTLSGGQKQRITLARALIKNPKIIFLDDFTARVDKETENRIWSRIEENYPNTTLISITQKIESIVHFDKIIFLMEGELIATGTHQELLNNSKEYQQLLQSQKII
jgi:ATP-binding cassette subfamily B protein